MRMRQCGDTRSTSTQDDVLRANSWSCVQGPEWMWVVLRGCSLTSEANWGDDVIGRVCSQVLCGNGMAGRTKGAEFSGELISTGTPSFGWLERRQRQKVMQGNRTWWLRGKWTVQRVSVSLSLHLSEHEDRTSPGQETNDWGTDV